MLSDIFLVVVLTGTPVIVIAIVVTTLSDLGATADQRRRNFEKVCRAFDGRPEVKVQVHGAGMTAEQTAWLGYQYGYSVSHFETHRGSPRRLVMRRTNTAVPPNTGGTPGWPTPPVSVRMEHIQEELRQAPDPVARERQFWGLLAFGAGSAIVAVREFHAGRPYALAAATVSAVFLAGAAVLARYARRANQRKRKAAPPRAHPGPVPGAPLPPPPANNPYMAPPPPGYGPPPGHWPPGGQQPPQSP
ncbi:hypothetical protein O1L44_11410 [Streptomyces noursei]|uniref:hypothetical protein n=1 Tax=Streptomyces noursei TaxID=1971 RepID=UPI00081D2A39|nr:membrane protein [Streptomyces noursei ATCC 11455]MCZ0993597.1 hypothetical protein [Streptomyces noursei]